MRTDQYANLKTGQSRLFFIQTENKAGDNFFQPYYPSTIREEELKNRVAADFFGAYDCTRIVGNIDFCVSAKA